MSDRGDYRSFAPGVTLEHFVGRVFYEAWVSGAPLVRPKPRHGGGRFIARRIKRGKISVQTRAVVLREHGALCVFCGETPSPPTLDHVVPVVYGGSSRPCNLRPACGRCNSMHFSRAFGAIWNARQGEAPLDWRSL